MLVRALSGNGGGGGTPSVEEFSYMYGAGSNTKQMTIDLSKKYLLIVSDAISSEANGLVYYINNGNKSCIYESESNIDNRVVTVSISGTTLTITMSWTQRYFTVVLTESA